MEANNYFIGNREKWLMMRKGRITASDFWKLFQSGKRPMTTDELAGRESNDRKKTIPSLFGEIAMTLIRSKIAEMTSTEFEREINGNGLVKSMEWGVQHEEEAKNEFEKRTGLSVLYHGLLNPVFYTYGDFAGGSPDGDILDINAALELKCPVDENVHMRRLLIRSVEQFKREEYEAYCQLQGNMYIMKRDFGYFASYDPRKKEEALRMKIIKLKPDLEWQKEFDERLTAAIEIMADVLFDTDKYLFVE